jgi:hypothetical protein
MGSLIASWENCILWQALFQIILAVVFSALQVYSLTIHYSLFKKYGQMEAEVESNANNPEDVASNGINADIAPTTFKEVLEVELGEETEATDGGIETRSVCCKIRRDVR